MEDSNPDSAASPATPGTGKSKLDTLSKEDLIKFTKKQVVVLQKVKARCADLEQEVEKLKNKSNGGADEAIIQELTERMDAVLLEKAETQQRLVLLRKENEKAKQEAKDALDKVTELQKQFDLSNVEHLKKIEDVKHELETVHSKHKEEAADLQKLLQESSKKEQMLTAQFRQQLGNQNEVKELEEQFKLVRQKYEDQLSSLQQQLISSEEERRQETTMLKENQEAAIAECQKEIESLHGELLKIRTAHQEEVKELVDQLESAALEHEQERYRLLQVNEDLTEQLDQKENSLQDVEEEEETGIEWVKKHSEPLASGEQGEDEVINLKRMLKDLQSQHSILQDELTYLSNMKTELELELQQAKDEFLREKEELEFNINELQLCNEDNDSIATKCKSDLQTTNDHWEMALNQHEQELQVLKQRHQKEIVALEQTLLSAAEKEKGKALLEIQNLKEECEKLSVEKDEAVDSYEKTMEILRNVQSELGDTTGNFVKQYNAMKESNAAEIHELQQKLRVAFNEKDKLLERINNLESEAKSQQDTFEELKLSESDWENKKQELLSIQHHKDTALRELEEKLAALNLEKDDVLTALKHSEVEVKKLRDAFSTEQAQCDEFQQKLENLTKDKTQIKALEEELTNLKKERDNLQEELHLVRSDRDSLSKFKDEIGNLEKSSQAVSEEKERLRNNFEEKLQQLTELQHRLEDLTKDKAQLHQRLDEAEMQLGTTFADKENITHQLKILESKLTVTCLEKEQKCSDLKALEEDLTNLKNERDHLQEELKLARSDSNNLYKLKGETGDLEKSLQAVSQEKERLRKDLEEKQQQLTDFQHRLEYLTKDNTQLQQRLDEAEIQMGANAAEKESISHQLEILENKVTASCLEKEQKCSDLKALEEDLTNLKNERDRLQEELNLARSDSNNLYKLKGETRDLEKSLQAVSQEKERLRKDLEEKQQQLTDFQHRLEYLAKDNTQLQQRLDEAEIQTGANAAEKESISHQLEILENKVAALCLEKEQKCSDLKALEEHLTNLKKERDETGNLEKSLQAVSEEKERFRKDLEEKQQQLAEVRVHIFNYLQQEAGIEVFANNDQEVEDISVLLQKLWDKVMEGKRSALLQSDERIAQLQDGIEKLREEGRLQEVELRSFNDDLSKERTLLKENLEEVLSDKEGLQRDLLEMKSRNENMRVENEALLAQIEAVSEKLKKIEKEKNDEIDQTVQQVVGDDEREKLLRLLAEKESELSNLQGEIASLQESKQNSSPAEEVVRELTDKIGNLEKEHKEKHEKMNKIKAVAVKAKKELDTTRKEVQALKEELELVKTERERLSGSVKDVIQAAESYKNLLAEYDKQTEQLDLEKERADNCDRQIGELTKHLQAAVLQKDKLISEKEDQLTCLETLQMNVKQLEAQILELQKGKSAVEKELEGEKLLKEHKIKDHSTSLKEIEDLQRHLQKQNQKLQQAVQELEILRKDAQQSSLMDMEMADYERLVKELNQNISDKESRIEEYEGEIKIQKQRQETLQEEISSLKSCLDQTEDKNTKIKQLLVKTKKELADAKKSEANQLAIQSSLKGELEASQQQLEDYKIQCADLTAERHKLQEQLRSMTDQLQRAKSAFQQKIATLQEECTAAKAEQVSTASEFESYKVRVHNVLKQQKNKSASQNEKDAATQERECMERMMDQLKAKLQETQHSLQANMNELQALQSEHDTLLERHNKMLQETVAKEAELGDKLRSIQSENKVLKSEHAQTLSHLTDQNEALQNSFREQVRHLQEDHRKTVETLQQQVSKVEAQLFQLQKEASTTSPVPVQQTRKLLQERKNADLLLFDLQSMAREEGEGMETTETESVSSSGTHIPSLELLLNSPEPKMEPLVWQAEPTKEELAQELNTATKSIEHMNGLLHDTEATNAILMEQITLLKSEVRRLERNQEREKSVANLEYLKNVLLQFIFLKSGSERQALLPVIHTMLQLSPEERSKLSAIAQGEEEAVVASRSSGWTSYLHSWSGIR